MRALADLGDAFWRAVASSMRPSVIALSLLPLALTGAAAGLLGWFFWQDATDAVAAALYGSGLAQPALAWLDALGAQALRMVLVPLIVVGLTVPVLVVATLLAVAWLIAPRLTRLVATRRFPALERRGSAGFVDGLARSLGATAVALLALIATLPLWLVPPFTLLLPPLIWGWLNAKVMAFDALAAHATADERRTLLRSHRWPLLLIGIATAGAGAAPALLWAFSATTLVFAPVLIVLSVWVYTLVFIGASLWFAHYALAALARLRAAQPAGAVVDAVDVIDVDAATPVREPCSALATEGEP
ncbi:MAG TPA: EI24 domain-containing protein [Methylibium sp.]|uniref:EI24 domain-containing protein n=1 Tax=Methylibium sp. TaxID=2067992 RepID=UPI002DBA623B|nr:EI24 domain-containing protein [Methylibium sp.]HEU4460299.1 EI24 domain-containing protein [Methylibium sp.]